MLTALGEVIGEWAGSRLVKLDTEGHGREELADEMDTTRTVGWFTALYPVVIEPGEGALADKLRRIKEEIRTIPGGGVGYGVLKFIVGAPMEDDLGVAESELCFNYLGQFDQVVKDVGAIKMAKERVGWLRSEKGKRRYKVNLDCRVVGGELRMDWSYSRDMYERTTIQRLSTRY